ncbi:MAG: hydroxyquinol 1,2-dioxygenase [Proteobacteria bacterium]|nr:hydroxyquinol 1,2-dioxygenase [Pseudomonadota bacterium]MYJ94333.1 hydroxyquinol 1,2-dioxygenase [Pseudomonadota bacterium]
MAMTEFRTVFGSLKDYTKGEIEIINDDRKNYAFSNMFEVAATSAPYERVVVGKNVEYVLEAIRAEGTSDWYTAAHDEFALVMDGTVELDLVKLDDPHSIAPPDKEGAVKLDGEPVGRKMGRIRMWRGHQALLPTGAAYRFRAPDPDAVGVILMQTILGDESVEKWSEICYT